jgi:germination protein M
MRALTRVLALLAATVLVVAACGNDDTGTGDTTTTTEATTTTIDDTTTTDPDDTTTTTEDEPAETSAVSVYFLSGEKLRVGYVREVEGVAVATAAVEELLDGPNADDEELGLSTTIPEGTELLGIEIDDERAIVDLSGEFAEGGGSLSMNARVAQVVYTVTQFPTVESVRFHLDGEAIDTLGGEGLMMDHDFTRADFEFPGDYEHLKPGILVETPRPGETVSDQIRVAGRSNTFEAALYFEVQDTEGNVVVEETYAMATSGTGTPGDFDETLDLPADTPSEIVLLAYELSARDGSREGISEIPLFVD